MGKNHFKFRYSEHHRCGVPGCFLGVKKTKFIALNYISRISLGFFSEKR